MFILHTVKYKCIDDIVINCYSMNEILFGRPYENTILIQIKRGTTICEVTRYLLDNINFNVDIERLCDCEMSIQWIKVTVDNIDEIPKIQNICDPNTLLIRYMDPIEPIIYVVFTSSLKEVDDDAIKSMRGVVNVTNNKHGLLIHLYNIEAMCASYSTICLHKLKLFGTYDIKIKMSTEHDKVHHITLMKQAIRTNGQKRLLEC